MKKKIIIFLLLFSVISSAQNKTIYVSESISLSDAKIKNALGTKVVGSNVRMTYDSLFDNYSVNFTDKNGKKVNMTYELEEILEDGNKIYKFKNRLFEIHFTKNQKYSKNDKTTYYIHFRLTPLERYHHKDSQEFFIYSLTKI